MSSLYAQYLIEKTDDLIFETEDGFATYVFLGKDQVYIKDIFVVPALRKSDIAKDMADHIAYLAKSRGCTEMLGTVIPSNKNSTDSIKVLVAYGMTLKSSSNDLIVFRKDI